MRRQALDTVPVTLHARVALVPGSRGDVPRVTRHHHEADGWASARLRPRELPGLTAPDHAKGPHRGPFAMSRQLTRTAS